MTTTTMTMISAAAKRTYLPICIHQVRECAGEVLVHLLRSSCPRLPGISERMALEAALFLPPAGANDDDDDEIGGNHHPERCNWASPALVFPRVVRLLSIEAYHKVGRYACTYIRIYVCMCKGKSL